MSEANPTVQRTRASRFAQRQIERPRRLALVPDLRSLRHHTMQNSLFKGILGGLVVLLLTAPTANAEHCLGPRSRVHDWTVRISGGHYGLIGYNATTSVVVGQSRFSIPMHIFVVAGCGALAVAGLSLMGIRAIREKETET